MQHTALDRKVVAAHVSFGVLFDYVFTTYKPATLDKLLVIPKP